MAQVTSYRLTTDAESRFEQCMEKAFSILKRSADQWALARIRPQKVLQYLARYTHRVAISNERLIEIDDDHVVFRFKDYARGGIWETRRLSAEEFIRRFLQHVLPRRFVRIRYFGLLGNRYRRENLERARAFLKAEPPKDVAPEGETRQELLERLTGADPHRCPKCGQGRLRLCREFPRPRSSDPTARAPP